MFQFSRWILSLLNIDLWEQWTTVVRSAVFDDTWEHERLGWRCTNNTFSCTIFTSCIHKTLSCIDMYWWNFLDQTNNCYSTSLTQNLKTSGLEVVFIYRRSVNRDGICLTWAKCWTTVVRSAVFDDTWEHERLGWRCTNNTFSCTIFTSCIHKTLSCIDMYWWNFLDQTNNCY